MCNISIKIYFDGIKTLCILKLGASLTIYSSKFLMGNDNLKEEPRFSRIVGNEKNHE